MEEIIDFTENKILNPNDKSKYHRIQAIYHMIWDNWDLHSYDVRNLPKNDVYHIFMKIRYNNHTMQLDSKNKDALLYGAGLFSMSNNENELLLLKKASIYDDQEVKFQLAKCLIKGKYPNLSIKHYGKNFKDIGYEYLEELCVNNYKLATNYVSDKSKLNTYKDIKNYKIFLKSILHNEEYIDILNYQLSESPHILFHKSLSKLLFDIDKKYKLEIPKNYIDSYLLLHKKFINNISTNLNIPNEISNIIYNFV
tara:strand:+ start:27370 stop:28128 length:759 start_codon:yes stop_codon:yes gene_type:complete